MLLIPEIQFIFENTDRMPTKKVEKIGFIFTQKLKVFTV